MAELVDELERVIIASNAITARVLAEVAPEMTAGQWRVIIVVGQPGIDDEGLSMGGVARDVGASLSAASRLVSRLRDRGLVETSRQSHDGRVTAVRLTARGQALRSAVIARRRAELADQVGLDAAGADDRLASARVADILEATATRPGPASEARRRTF